MQYRWVGGTGIQVAEFGLGTMTFGQECDAKLSAELLGDYLAAGGNLIDTADGYGGGRAEELLGKALQGHRHEVILSTKARFPTGPGVNDRGSSRLHLTRAVDESLTRLATDYIDILHLHCWDSHTDLAETMAVLDDLVRRGKVLYVGVSNFAARQVAKALGLAALLRLTAPTFLQLEYSLAERGAERELLPLAAEERLHSLIYAPLGGGLLTGKYADALSLPAGSRAAVMAARGSKTMHRRMTERNFALVGLLGEYADQLGCSSSQLAISWLAGRAGVGSILLGATSRDQLAQALAAQNVMLPPEMADQLTEASKPESGYPEFFLRQSADR